MSDVVACPIRPAALVRFAPLAVAFAVSARESWLFIEASSFTVDGQRYFALFDDAMISMRYASNLVQGRGLVWNPGERVEGFTNPLWVLVMSAALLVFSRLNAVLAMQVVGAVLHAAAALIFAKLGGRFFRASPWPVVAIFEACFFWLLMHAFPLRFWSHMGMEVSALLVVAALAWALVLRPNVPPHGTIITRLGVLAAVAYLLRPDGFLVVLPPLMLACLRARPLPKVIARATLPLAITVVVSALRRAYFGDWLPNTYRLKMGRFPIAVRLPDGLAFLQPYLHQIAILAVLGVVACAVTRSWRALALAASPIVLFAYQVWVGGEPWPYWRQLSPGYPALLLLVAAGFAAASALIRRRFRRARPLRWVAPIIAGASMAAAMEPTRAAFADGFVVAYNVAWAKSNVERALLFRKILRPDARIAVIWAGVTPYYDEGRHAIDLLGKCDRKVAEQAPDLSGLVGAHGMRTMPGHNKTLLAHSIIDLGADYTETFEWGSDELSPEDRRRFRWVRVDEKMYLLRRGSPRIDWDAVERVRDRGPEEAPSDAPRGAASRRTLGPKGARQTQR